MLQNMRSAWRLHCEPTGILVRNHIFQECLPVPTAKSIAFPDAADIPEISEG